VELIPQAAADTYRSSPRTWQPVRPEDAARLSDCRLQLHHAAQFGTAAGISFLEHRPDDSHTNLEWIAALGGLFSRAIPTARPFRIGARPSRLALLIVTEDNQPIAEYKLHGRTITDATQWIRAQIKSLGADPALYTLRRHYEIPAHPVAIGESFDASAPTRFEELSKWFANASALLGSVVRKTRGASEVRCWPHHFNLATLIKVAPDCTIGIGMEPGDDYYDEPYFYLNMTPQPIASRAQSRPLWGKGIWHTNEWVGAVLPGSRFGGASAQERQVREFVDSATAACRGLLTQD
jgi:hypothetical protein